MIILCGLHSCRSTLFAKMNRDAEMNIDGPEMSEVICKTPLCGHAQNVNWEGNYTAFDCANCKVYQVHCRCGAGEAMMAKLFIGASGKLNHMFFKPSFKKKAQQEELCMEAATQSIVR